MTARLRVVDDFYRALQAKDLDAWGELWTADAVYRVPVTPDGVRGEFAGRETIVAALRGFFALFGRVRFTWDAEPGGDPRRVLATWTLEVELLAGGVYRNRGVALFRLEGERIAEFTEYADTAAFLGVFCAKAATARRFFTLLRDRDSAGWGALWHEHGALSVPYPPRGCPALIEGREKIVAAYGELFGVYGQFDTELTGVHPAVSSDTVCVEFQVRAHLPGGAVHTAAGAGVFRFRGGLISAYHGHFDPRRFREAADALRGV
ncbi:nuclear transport factor 2 family protein [Streptomyces sp. NBC_01506]|uniref:nuclear transport factor 2 family protein n=1 Tax=Streptomyces sp. NBC_01506 TaxID=2903887 RepID=UPI0038670610